MSEVAQPHLEMRNITMSFKGFQALNDLCFSVSKGELRCFIGPNGAGKTTALDLICGKIKPTSVEITLDGVPLHNLEEHQIARNGVGRKFQIPSVFRQLTVRQNLDVAHCKRTGVLANVIRFGRSSESDGLEMLAEVVGLLDYLETHAGQLSHGQTQWLEISLLLAQDPEIILMDELTAGMTIAETQKTAGLFNKLRGSHTLVVVEHGMGFIREIGDTVSVMHQGNVLAEGSISEIEQDPSVSEAYLGSGGMARA